MSRTTHSHRLILSTLSVVCFIACQDSISANEELHRQAAIEFVNLTANYTPADVGERFDRARSVLGEPAKKVFGEAILGAEQTAVVSTQRSQVFEIDLEQVASEEIDAHSTLIQVTGERVRTVAGKSSPPLRIDYLVTVSAALPDSLQIVDVRAMVESGQGDILGEEALLNKLNEASAAAQEERSKFKDEVNFVQSDLNQHQEKVEENFRKLSDSLDRLGSKVRKLGDDVRSLRDTPQQTLQQPQAHKPNGAVPNENGAASNEAVPTVGPTIEEAAPTP